MDIDLDFDGESRTIHVTDPDISLGRLRKHILDQMKPGANHDWSQWTMTADGQAVGFLDANQRKARGVMRISLYSRGTKKRAREPDAATVTAIVADTGESHNVVAALVRILNEHRNTLAAEVAGEGMQMQHIFGVMGHISARFPHAHVATEPVSVARVAKERAPGVSVALVPMGVVGHVSLCCFYQRGQRVIHLDASSSVASYASEILRYPNRSYCLINYQVFDETSEVENLAGGNCGLFVCIQAIRCITAASRYADRRVSFADFWSRFMQVLHVSGSSAQQDQMMAQTLRRLFYIVDRHGERDGFSSMARIGGPSPDVFSKLPDGRARYNMFRAYFQHAMDPTHLDFTADMIMLDLFVETGLGFHQVNLLGSVLRLYMRDFVERGLISGNVPTPSTPIPTLAAWIILGDPARPSPEDVERLVDDLLSRSREYREWDADRIERELERKPRVLAELVLRQYMPRQDALSAQNLARTYLQQWDIQSEKEKTLARQQEKLRALLESARKMPVSGESIEGIVPRVMDFRVELDSTLYGYQRF